MMEDLGKNLSDGDYCQDIYISTKHKGSITYRECAYFDTPGYIFVWTRIGSELLSIKEIGDYIIVPKNDGLKITVKVT